MRDIDLMKFLFWIDFFLHYDEAFKVRADGRPLVQERKGKVRKREKLILLI